MLSWQQAYLDAQRETIEAMRERNRAQIRVSELEEELRDRRAVDAQADLDRLLGVRVRAIVASHAYIEIEELTDGFEARPIIGGDWIARKLTLDAAVEALAARLDERSPQDADE